MRVLIIVVLVVVAGFFAYKYENTSKQLKGQVINSSSMTATTGAGIAVEGSTCTHTYPSGSTGTGTVINGCCSIRSAGVTNCYSDFSLGTKSGGATTSTSSSAASMNVNAGGGTTTTTTTKTGVGASGGSAAQ